MATSFPVQVECHPGTRGDELPHRLRFDGRRVDVEVIDRWEGPAYRYFKLRGSDGGVYIVRHEAVAGVWTLVIYDSDALDGSRLSS